MRIHLKTVPNEEPITFNYQPRLVGCLHKWLGKNEIHGSMSLHSFSWLKGSKCMEDALWFPEGAAFFISFQDASRIRKIVKSILADPGMFGGMSVTDVSIEEDPDLSARRLFQVASPVFIRRSDGGNDIHYTYENESCGMLLTETLKHKMRLAGLAEDETLDIRFDTSYPKKKVKLVTYNGIKNKVSLCPLLIDGRPETKQFAWNVGIGNSTGIGLGAIY